MSGLTFTLNGHTETPNTGAATTLLEYLRRERHTGTKEGCGDGDCGACTVVIAMRDAKNKTRYVAVNSCLVPLGAVAGREVITVEGVADAQPHPVQQALIDTAGSQCGYCTPGFIMSLFAGYYDGSAADDVTIEGNLCRCTGYAPIRKAAHSLGKPAADDPFMASEGGRTQGSSLRVDGFFYPQTLSDLFEVWAAQPEATLIAGGTDLGLELSHKSRDFKGLISLENVRELTAISDTPDALTLGAAAPLTQIEREHRGTFPALDEMLRWFAARQIRNRATVGGNLATASPIGDLAPVLLALNASLTLASKDGERRVPLAEFFTGYRQTILAAGELIKSVTLPKAFSAGAAQRFSQAYKVGKRGTDDISTVAAAFTVDIDDTSHIIHTCLAYGGVAATPVRATQVERDLLGQPWTPSTVQAAKAELQSAFRPLDDFRGSAKYRNLLIGNLFEKFFVQHSLVKAAM